MHVAMADESFRIGPAPAKLSYLNSQEILAVARESGAQAIHPGYGFLSENFEFARACEDASIRFIGPTPQQIHSFGLKHAARTIAANAKIPLLPGSGLLPDAIAALRIAEEIGLPVMIKSATGGGGIGLQVCRTASELAERYETVKRLGEENFNEGGVYIEKFVELARHIEVQIFGDGKGNVIALGERDCTIQRRNQKVIEETPAPGISQEIRGQLSQAAALLGKTVRYASAGTVEFIYDSAEERFYFLKVNTRLQVEHGLTEEAAGIDLVEWMIRLASGELPALNRLKPSSSGHSIQARIYAEDPNKNFQPCSGLLTEVVFPANHRVDTWVERGTEVSPYYDPLLAKIIVKGADRQDAIAKMSSALEETQIHGVETNQDYLKEVLGLTAVQRGEITTQFLNKFQYNPRSLDVIESGTQTSVQDFPGRLGFWSVGVPPSGPMDPLAFRLGNRLLANDQNAAGLEMTISGPTLRFNADREFCLTGAAMKAELDGRPVPFWTVAKARRGQTLRIGRIVGGGARAYLLIAGGFDVPNYLGSKSTFVLGGFGGHGGRVLRTGDVLRLNPDMPAIRKPAGRKKMRISLHKALIPVYSTHWEIGVLYGPHGAPDFFISEDINAFFAADWKVHYNSNRTGIRLIGPKPQWARKDGDEAGLHPSNIHDNAYAIGSVAFTGAMPILLGPDGPSLGGFVCPCVVVDAEIWKLGQLKAGDTVRFRPLTAAEAENLKSAQEREIETLQQPATGLVNISNFAARAGDEAMLAHLEPADDRPRVVYRRAGDSYLLVEYGPPVLNLDLRFRVHALMEFVTSRNLQGMIDLTPGIRSLQLHFDNRKIHQKNLLQILLEAEKELPRLDEVVLATRIVHMPLSWEDGSTLLAIQRYMQSVRADAPWCPSNLEFIRRVNGLESIDEVKRIIFDASYLVLGLGDVYLGAPIAVPIDPRHRLIAIKYNPASPWTPENAVGLGGACLCIYGMEGPGAYQFVGRTVQVWNRFRVTQNFEKPWLLRFFDQIRFYPVSAEQLLRDREDFLQGKFNLKIEPQTFRLRDYNAFLALIDADAAACKARQQQAFNAERERWAATEFVAAEEAETTPIPSEIPLPEHGSFIDSPIAGNLWKLLVTPGEMVAGNQPIAIIESMKTEMQIVAHRGGKIHSVLCKELSPVAPGQHLFILEERQ
jgi:urea carboxylase